MNIKKDSLELITYFKNCLSLNEYDYLANSNIVLNCLKEDKNISEAYITVNNYLNPTFKEIQETFQKILQEICQEMLQKQNTTWRKIRGS